jgi:hypothetical protein
LAILYEVRASIKTSPLLIPKTYSYLKHTLSITNNYFYIFNNCCNILLKSNHQEYGREINPLHLDEREVSFDDYQKILGNGDWMGNLLDHLQSPKYQLFDIGERDE